MDYVRYSEIAAALAGLPVHWSEQQLLSLGRQKGTPLPYVRLSNRTSPALWNRKNLVTWFSRKYRTAPEIVATFVQRLNASAPVGNTKSKGAKRE